VAQPVRLRCQSAAYHQQLQFRRTHPIQHIGGNFFSSQTGAVWSLTGRLRLPAQSRAFMRDRNQAVEWEQAATRFTLRIHEATKKRIPICGGDGKTGVSVSPVKQRHMMTEPDQQMGLQA